MMGMNSSGLCVGFDGRLEFEVRSIRGYAHHPGV